MPKIKVSYEFDSEAEAVAFLGGKGGVATGGNVLGGASAPAVSRGPAPTARTAPAVSSASAAPPARPASAAPPARPAAPAAAPQGSDTYKATLAAMQDYGKTGGFKAAGVKVVLDRAGVPAVKPDTDPAVLEWLLSVFSPQDNGAYYTPEEIAAM